MCFIVNTDVRTRTSGLAVAQRVFGSVVIYTKFRTDDAALGELTRTTNLVSAEDIPTVDPSSVCCCPRCGRRPATGVPTSTKLLH